MLIFQNNKYVIDPNMLAITVLAAIWERDQTPDKSLATAQLQWLYHMYHYKSTFRPYSDAERPYAIIKAVFPIEHQEWEWDKDEIMDKAVDWYKMHIRKNPVWESVRAYEQLIYNLTKELTKPDIDVYKASKARAELDLLPKSLKKMIQEAEKMDMVLDEKISGDKTIKRGERLPGGALK